MVAWVVESKEAMGVGQRSPSCGVKLLEEPDDAKGHERNMLNELTVVGQRGLLLRNRCEVRVLDDPWMNGKLAS